MIKEVKQGAPKKFNEPMHRFPLMLPLSVMEEFRKIAQSSSPKKSVCTVIQEILIQSLKAKSQK